MRSGMVTSDEPGIYRPGKWGIRIENLLATVSKASSEFGEFLGFEALTLCPIELKAVLIKELMADEIQWLNAYHQMVYERLSPYLEKDQSTLAWLKKNTAPIET
ncbi:MAG: M24 family metallopeptidase C-terminal domain-containing protein [Burkholderiales bacterium]|nr:M24 family metallopeptidase C-terminal domain-containing protein [Burkholderiales bacterium]